MKSDLPPHHEHTCRDAHCASVQTHQFYVGFVGSRGPRTNTVRPYDFLRFSPSRFTIAYDFPITHNFFFSGKRIIEYNVQLITYLLAVYVPGKYFAVQLHENVLPDPMDRETVRILPILPVQRQEHGI